MRQIAATKGKASLGLIDGPRNLANTDQWSRFAIGDQSTHTLEKHGDLRSNTNELLAPEFVFRVPKQLNEGDKCSPWMRSVDDETLQENASHHLTEYIVLDLNEEVQQEGGKPVGMSVGISQVEHHGAQEVVLS